MTAEGTEAGVVIDAGIAVESVVIDPAGTGTIAAGTRTETGTGTEDVAGVETEAAVREMMHAVPAKQKKRKWV